jgi:hypothetical protein
MLAYRAGAAVLDEAAIPDVETARESRFGGALILRTRRADAVFINRL